MAMGSTVDEFATRFVRALEGAARQGVHIAPGSGAGDLELQHLGGGAHNGEEPPSGRPRHLEAPPGPRDPGAPDGTSRLCYFLDGVQTSREVGRIGALPVVVATVAAAIVNRCERRFRRLELEGPPVVVRAVILPRRAGDERVETLWRLLRDAGLSELRFHEAPGSPDLLLDSTEFAAEAELDPSDYVGLREWALGRVRSLRERLESELLSRWELDDRTLEDSDAWIAVDGQLSDLRVSNRRAIGLIKSVARPEFTGPDVEWLMELAPGWRTTSFVPDWQLRRDPGEQRTSWYMRIWPPQRGADALGSLVRVEAPGGTPPEQVDEITRWVLAERAPISRPDPRWATMIYPIHYIEKVLKPLARGSERAYARLERQLAARAKES
jgi:hypothetical protein